MTAKKFIFHDSKGGSALAVRVTPRSSRNQIAEILDNGTVRIRLTASGDDKALNQALVNFLAAVLSIPAERLDIVAGVSGREKLVSILDMDVETVHQKIFAQLSLVE
jgi:uncharacterized protein